MARTARKRVVKRRPYRKRYRKRAVPVSGIPDKKQVKLRYAQQVSLYQAGTYFDSHIFQGNSCYDPDSSGLGHQPMGFDEWGAFYNKYMVNASKIEITFTTTGSTSGANTALSLLPTTDSAYTPSWSSFTEARLGKSTIIGPYTGQGIRRLSHYESTRKIWGDNNNLEETDYGANFGSNPNKPWYWKIMAETLDSSNMTTINANVVITYYVTLFDRISLPQS